jgi:predicted transposase YbfD/YdcC
MNNTKILLEENLALKKEIAILHSKLHIVKMWMEKEVKTQAHKIAKNKTSQFATSVKEDFLNENFEEVIANRINNYFGDLLLLNAPK